MHVAYLINQYPKVSHSFIRREIQAVERQGCDVTRLAIRGWDLELVDPADKAERLKTTYVLKDGTFILLVSLVRVAFGRPLRSLRAFLLASTMARRSDRSFFRHLAYLAEACRILPWISAKGIQHVHAHFGTNSAEVAMLLHELGGPSWSFTVHGPEEFDRRMSIGLAEKVRRCSFVAAISSFGRAQIYRLVDHELWPKIHIVHCGVDAMFERDATAVTQLSRRFVCVGRLCEQKGQLLLLQAAKHISEKGVDFELVLAGDGNMRSALERFIERNDLHRSVRITGWINGEQVLHEIASSRALVLPSFAEGLPVVIMEAMASSRPVISTFVAGIPELVHNGEHGWLVPAGDITALAEAMEACLNAPDAAILEMGAAARDRVMARHSIDREAMKLAPLFGNADRATRAD